MIQNCNVTGKYLFLVYEGSASIKNRSILSIQGVKNSPYYSKTGGKNTNFRVFLRKKPKIIRNCNLTGKYLFLVY